MLRPLRAGLGLAWKATTNRFRGVLLLFAFQTKVRSKKWLTEHDIFCSFGTNL
jgi:hypothetical protein